MNTREMVKGCIAAGTCPEYSQFALDHNPAL